MEKSLVIALNYVGYSDLKRRAYQEIAMRILDANKPWNCMVHVFNFPWETVHVPDRFTVSKTLSRNSKETIGNTRNLPYIKEIFDACSQLPCDVFGYVNSDILLT